MPKRSLIRFDASWEQPPNDVPSVIETSADERFIVGQWGQLAGAGGAAIWDVSTKKTVWRVRGTRVVTWIGDEIVAVATRENNAEYLVWYRWSDQKELGALPVRFPLGRLTHAPRIVGDARAKIAAVVWVDQSEGGIELFRRDADGWTHAADAGWWQKRTNYVGDVVFSADGRFLALPVGADDGWESNADGYAGVVVVWDTTTLESEFLDLVSVDRQAKPSPKCGPIPTILRFASPSELSVRLQNEEEVTLSFDPATFGTH